MYLATFASVEEPNEDNRRGVRLEHVQYAGTTADGWKTFVDTERNLIRSLPDE